MSELEQAVRERYAAAARQLRVGGTSCCDGTSAFARGYTDGDLAELGLAQPVSLGCGNPTLLAELREGERVLDLGSGAGLDVLLSARRVGPGGHAYGVDMTDEMLALAEENRVRAGVTNATFLRGGIAAVPLAAGSIDVVISNCVINLAEDKAPVLREAHRLLRPGGRLAVADMVQVEDLPDEVRRASEMWSGCIAGALPADQYRSLLVKAGFSEVEVVVHTIDEIPGGGRIGSAYIRASRPVATGTPALGPVTVIQAAGDCCPLPGQGAGGC